MTDNTRRMLSVSEIVERFNRQADTVKKAGAYEQSDTWHAAVVLLLRMADELEPSLDPSEPT